MDLPTLTTPTLETFPNMFSPHSQVGNISALMLSWYRSVNVVKERQVVYSQCCRSVRSSWWGSWSSSWWPSTANGTTWWTWTKEDQMLIQSTYSCQVNVTLSHWQASLFCFAAIFLATPVSYTCSLNVSFTGCRWATNSVEESRPSVQILLHNIQRVFCVCIHLKNRLLLHTEWQFANVSSTARHKGLKPLDEA